ncbi:hypothetical protein IV203_027825 [Nitzschia inconspicua]|uniref:Uncharacterized protein n=1 Tax=Nitzschia inconspicua TaxID=303405 RepID=A0A9K3Q6E7_9STRA|nr:hypothetical protein IV203_027825 [Nitzschia inconspicua]
MSPSFHYPKQLLHHRIEAQWFPNPNTTPTLTVLEDAEETYRQKMSKIVSRNTPLAVIGRTNNNGTSSISSNSRRRSSTRGMSGTTAGDSSTAAETNVDDVSTVVQMRLQQPPANTTLLWNRDRPAQRR